jgi:hypothetical protein
MFNFPFEVAAKLSKYIGLIPVLLFAIGFEDFDLLLRNVDS